MYILKRYRIYAIMVLLLISIIFVDNKAYARVYVNESGKVEDVEEDDDIEVEPIYDINTDEPIEEGGDDDTEEGPSIGPGEGIDGGGTLPVFETVSGNKIWMGWRKYHYNFIQDPLVRKGQTVNFLTRIVNTITGGEDVREGHATATGYGTYMIDYRRHMIGLLNYIKQNIEKMTYSGIVDNNEPNDIYKEGGREITYNGCDYCSNIRKVDKGAKQDDKGVLKYEYYKMSEVCDYVMKKIAATGYNSTYENDGTNDTGNEDGFLKFWDYCFKDSKKDILNSLQTNFYYRAYAKNAITKLRKMGFPFPSDSTGYKPAIYGMIFSIMEARYRNRDINGKLNLELKVAEGDLWPFLVNLKNLDKVVRTGAKGNYHYKIVDNKEEAHDIGREDWPLLNDIVDGCYQWMAYYESGFMESTSASTVSSSQIEEEADDDADSMDWEAEYMELTNEECLPDVDSSFYERVSMVRSTFKKSSENQEGIFGAEELYNIESETTLTEAMENMKECMINTFGKDVWEGLKDYNIERSYLLAKNIVENERLQSEYSYYNIGTNIIDATPGQRGNEYLLADFQRIKLQEPIKGKDGAFTNCDTDNDGLLDRDELGSRDSTGNGEKEVDVTAFIETMIRSELLGRGEVSRDSTDEAILEATMQEFRTNLNKRRQEVYEREAGDPEGTDKEKVKAVMNGIDVEEVNEHYLKSVGNNFFVKLYDYKSNPILKDTDFDGLSDKEEKEKEKAMVIVPAGLHILLDNRREGNRPTEKGQINNANTHMDYRYFFMNNKVYYDELSTMSLMICNALENKNKEGTKDFKDINTLMQSIGLAKDEVEIKEAYDEYGSEGLLKPKKSKVEYVTGVHEVEYTHNYEETPISKKVKLIAIKSIDSNQGNIEGIGKNDREKEYNVFTKADHETFDKLANSIFAKEYEGNDYAYWVIGHGTGGAIANILAAKLIQNGKKLVVKEKMEDDENRVYLMFDNDGSNSYQIGTEKGEHNKVLTNVYAYTFGSPYTVYSGKDYLKLGNDIVPCHNDIFLSIFNVLNEDDPLCYLPSSLLGWDRYGANVALRSENRNAEYKKTKDAISKVEKFDNTSGYEYYGNKQKRLQVEKAFYNIFNDILTDNKNNMRDIYNKNEVLQKIFKDIVEEYMTNEGRLTSTLRKVCNGRYGKIDMILESKMINFIMSLSASNGDKAALYAHDTGAYYYLSKALKPENVLSMKLDNKDVLEWGEDNTKDKAEQANKQLIDAIEKMGDWYTKNVPTYQKHLQEETYATYKKKASGDKKEILSNIEKYTLTGFYATESNISIREYNTLTKENKDTKANNNMAILKGSEEAVKHYRDYISEIDLTGGLAYYKCEDIENSPRYKKAGDDCVRFAFACFNKMNNNFVKELEEYSGYTYGKIGSQNFIITDEVAYAMTKCGFMIYDVNGGGIDIDKDEINDFQMQKIDKNFKLQKGDFLARTGHVHFYMGDGNDGVNDNLGWGTVNRYYPRKYNFRVKDKGGGKFNILSDNGEYTRIYRYIGK